MDMTLESRLSSRQSNYSGQRKDYLFNDMRRNAHHFGATERWIPPPNPPPQKKKVPSRDGLSANKICYPLVFSEHG